MSSPVRVELHGLPYPWIAFYSLSKNAIYFVNAHTSESRFSQPPNEASTRLYTETGLPHPWIACKSKKRAATYYVNARTKESVWERPGTERGEPIPSVPLGKCPSPTKPLTETDSVPSTSVEGGVISVSDLPQPAKWKAKCGVTKDRKSFTSTPREDKTAVPGGASNGKKKRGARLSKPRKEKTTNDDEEEKPTLVFSSSFGTTAPTPSSVEPGPSSVFGRDRQFNALFTIEEAEEEPSEFARTIALGRPNDANNLAPVDKLRCVSALEEFFLRGAAEANADPPEEPMDVELVSEVQRRPNYVIVCDTSSLLEDPEIIDFLVKNNIAMYISRTVQTELERLKSNRSLDQARRKCLCTANSALRKFTSHLSPCYSSHVILEQSLKERGCDLVAENNDDRILISALNVLDTLRTHSNSTAVDCRVVLLTEDNIFAVRANSYEGILSADCGQLKRMIEKYSSLLDAPEACVCQSLPAGLLKALSAENAHSWSGSDSSARSMSSSSTGSKRRSCDFSDFGASPSKHTYRIQNASGSSIVFSLEEKISSFKHIVTETVNEILRRFGNAEIRDEKTTCKVQMAWIRGSAKKLSENPTPSSFETFLFNVKKAYSALNGPPDVLKALENGRSLFSAICSHQADILNDLSALAHNREYDLVEDYFA